MAAAKLSCTYLGGHPKHRRAGAGRLTIRTSELRFSGAQWFSIALADICQVRVERAGELDRRVTATRVAALGLLALAAKKKEDTRTDYLTVETRSGVVLVFAAEAKRGGCFAQPRTRVRGTTPVSGRSG